MPLLFMASVPCGPAKSCRSACPSRNATSPAWPMWGTLPSSMAGRSRPWISSHLEVRARDYRWLVSAGGWPMSAAAFSWKLYASFMK